MRSGVSQPKEAAPFYGGVAADPSGSFARRHQGEQAVAGAGVVSLCHLGSVLTSHFTDVTDAKYMGTSDALSAFKHQL